MALKSGDSSAEATIAASDPITVSISGPDDEVTEGNSGTYTVSLSPPGVTPSEDLTVSYATADGTGENGATAGQDYTDTSGTVTFTKTDTGDKTFTVQTTDDILAENSETFTASISSATGGGGPAPSLGTSSATTTIRDNDGLILSPSIPPDQVNILLTVSPSSVNEGAGETPFEVTATWNEDPRSVDVTIQLALGGTATLGSTGDYTAPATASVTIPANQASGTGTLTLNILDDTEVEGDETIIVGGSSGHLAIQSAVITIHDNEATYLSITGPAAEVTEGSNATFTVTLSKAVSEAVTVAWSDVPGTATTSDYTAGSGTVTFPANSTTQTFTIAVTDDSLSEPAETFSAQLGSVTADEADNVYVNTTAAIATATIAASDAITVSISGPSAVDEGDATTNYTVSLTGGTPTEDLTVDYATSDGTATAGSDYTAISDSTLTFTSDDHTAKTFTVQTTEDTLDEQDETFTVSLSDQEGGGGPAPVLGSTSSVETTINDGDDAPSSITLSVNPTSLGEDDGQTNVTVTATLDGSSTLTTSTTVTIGALTGTATKDTDYAVNTALTSITISAGQSSGSGTLTITPKDDTVVEGDETITVSGTATGFTVSSADITLTDDDKSTNTPGDKDKADLSIGGPSGNVDEGSNATFTVTLSKAVAKQVQVAWTATGNTDDYSPDSGTVTFQANSTTQTITITATDDALAETAESFTVTLGAITSDLSSQLALKTGANTAMATIAASDAITVSISGPSNVDEGKATTNYTVSISGGTPTADLTVNYATADGTGDFGATAGEDYTAKSGTLTFTKSDHADKTFTVQTTQDAIDESDETFTVTISSPSGGGGPSPSLGTAKSVTTTIDDDDETSNPPDDPGVFVGVDARLSVTPDRVNEGAGETDFTVTATSTRAAQSVDTTIRLTLGGTAEAGTGKDYTAPAQATVTIPANQTSGTGTLTLNILDDSDVEGDETIIVGGTSTGWRIASDKIIIQDDEATYLSITGPTENVAEGSNAEFTVTLSKSVSADVTVTWNASENLTDYSPDSGSVTFPANSDAGATQTITIAIEDESWSEPEETFNVVLGTDSGDQAGIVFVNSTAYSAQGTIAESDAITVSITGPDSVAEGDDTGNYTVSLTGGRPTEDLTVDYATSDDTATAGSDYTAISDTTLTFTSADHADKTFTVQTTEDTLDEQNETFTVSLSDLSGGGGPAPVLGTSSVSTRITDDDGTASSITLSVNPASLGEDAGETDITVTATLDGSNTLTTSTTVTIGALAGTATKDTDYAVNTALTSITIPANTLSGKGTLTITPNDDVIVEGDETIIVSGTTTVGLTVSDATITLTDGDTDKVELSISGPSGNVDEGSNATFTVTLSKAVAKQVRVAWTATGNTDDYSPGSGTVTFPPNSTTQTITITATDDLLSETAESFTVTLGAITSDLSSQLALKTSASSAQATIAASDPITVGIRGVSSVSEGNRATYTVSISGGTPTDDLTVQYATEDGTATAGSDYEAVPATTLTFTPTDHADKTVTVSTTEDELTEPDETYTVALSSPSGGGGATPTLGTDGTSVETTIADDDEHIGDPPPINDPPLELVSIILGVAPGSITEHAGATTVTVTAAHKSGEALTSDVTVNLTWGGGTATADDYTATALASVTIPANSVGGSGTLTITPIDDDAVESDETIKVAGSVSVEGVLVGSAQIVLVDNDTEDITLSVSDLTVDPDSIAENAPAAIDVIVTATLKNGALADDKTINLELRGTASSSDYSAKALSRVTIEAGETRGSGRLRITPFDDQLIEGDETIVVSGKASALKVRPAVITIVDDDTAVLSITGPSRVAEGALATFTVTLSENYNYNRAVLVPWRANKGTAGEEDYSPARGHVTFPANSKTGEKKTFTITATDDTLPEEEETFTLELGAITDHLKSQVVVNPNRKSVTTAITDNDATPSRLPDDPTPPDVPPVDPPVGPTPTPTPTPGPTPAPTPEPTPAPEPTPVLVRGLTPTPTPEPTPVLVQGLTPTPTPTPVLVQGLTPTPTPGTTPCWYKD